MASYSYLAYLQLIIKQIIIEGVPGKKALSDLW